MLINHTGAMFAIYSAAQPVVFAVAEPSERRACCASLQAEQVRQAEAAAAASSERRQQLELRTAERAARLQRRCASHSTTDPSYLCYMRSACRRLACAC